MRSVEDFWTQADRSGGPDACWPWLGSAVDDSTHSGVRRGRVRIGGRFTTASRYALEVSSGAEVHPRAYVLHSCDNPLCVNPAHLRAGTPGENQRERRARGRHGPNHRVLTADSVREIHRLTAEGDSRTALAQKFGVNPSMISHVRSGIRWHHIWEEFHQAVAA